MTTSISTSETPTLTEIVIDEHHGTEFPQLRLRGTLVLSGEPKAFEATCLIFEGVSPIPSDIEVFELLGGQIFLDNAQEDIFTSAIVACLTSGDKTED